MFDVKKPTMIWLDARGRPPRSPSYIWCRTAEHAQSVMCHNLVTHISIGPLETSYHLVLLGHWIYNNADQIAPPAYWCFRDLDVGSQSTMRNFLRNAHAKFINHRTQKNRA